MRKRQTCLNHTLRRLCCTATLIGLLQATLVAAQPLFTDITDAVGLDAYDGAPPSNVVFVDYNNDGFQDVFFAEFQTRQIGLFPEHRRRSPDRHDLRHPERAAQCPVVRHSSRL